MRTLGNTLGTNQELATNTVRMLLANGIAPPRRWPAHESSRSYSRYSLWDGTGRPPAPQSRDHGSTPRSLTEGPRSRSPPRPSPRQPEVAERSSSNQKQSSSNQKQSSSNQKQSSSNQAAIKQQSEAIKQQSEAIKQQSEAKEAIRSNQRPSEAIFTRKCSHAPWRAR